MKREKPRNGHEILKKKGKNEKALVTKGYGPVQPGQKHSYR